ncbi:MAG: DUF72 domain-containing protein [Deltaproteobacteria bacterium]|nr:MAG: DUF72 domain-containing protein [Deltaproteobacteria bacterium]
MRGRLRVGTSGYHYAHWQRVFYPDELPTAQWLRYYASRFDTVEINNTFYRLPEPETFDAWRDQVSAGFCFALKFSRFGTHVKRLRAPREPIERFLERARRLKRQLGPILVQLPPNWHADPARLAGFLEATPARTRFAIEFRDASWLCDPVYALLRQHGAALCIHDGLDDHPRELTAGWVYLRFHGDRTRVRYSAQALTAQARRIRRWLADGYDVYAYFNNDARGYALSNAADLRRYVQGDARTGRSSP